jgi:hypothetical protein
MTISLVPARAAASRRNGAKSRGPKSPEGKERSAQNALKHGLRDETFVVAGAESAEEFAALEAALIDELAPDGALQRVLAERIARAAWRLERAERIEGQLFDHHGEGMGLALVRASNGSGAFDTLLRYRGTAMAELWRALRMLKALQAEVRAGVGEAAPRDMPNEPEGRTNPGEIACDRTIVWLAAPRANPIRPDADADSACGDAAGVGDAAACASPSEPEIRRNPGEIASTSVASAHRPTQKCATMHRCATPGRRMRCRPARKPSTE